MKLAIMQPYFFPYIGYFQLLAMVDKFLLLDDVQYIRHGWVNRNRTLKPGGGWQYVVAPLAKHSSKETIRNIRVSDNPDWKQRILRQLHHYHKRAKFYRETVELVERCLNSSESDIARLNQSIIQAILEHLDISAETAITSDLPLNYDNVDDAGDWALTIAKQMNADEYINPADGMHLFDSHEFAKFNIELSGFHAPDVSYLQGRGQFESRLSIIDVLMFNDRDQVRSWVNQGSKVNR